jgi:tetratricopeptide (TPR) repeat protein
MGRKKPQPPVYRDLGRHLLLVAAVAVVWRVAAWALLSRTPFFDTPVVDASQFDLWARAVAAGREFQPGAFFKPPFYPHLLGALYQLGLGIRGVYALQAAVGVGVSLLVLVIARRLLPPRGALAAGLATALLPILPFFEFQLLAESWTTLLTLMAVAWLLTALDRPDLPTARAAALAGAALALATLGRPNLLLVIVAAAVWLGLVLRRSGRRAVRPVASLLIVAAVVILPTTIRNWRESGMPVLVSANLGANLVTGNRDRADGVSAIPVGVEWDDLQLQSFQAGHREPAASSRWLTGVALAWIGEHPGREAELLGRRVLALFSGWEPRNNIGAAWLAERHGVVILRRWWPGTWLLLPLAIVGLVAAPWNRVTALLAVVIGAQALSVLPFFVNARFRLPLLALLAIFAVIGVRALAEARRGTGRRGGVLIAVLVAAALLVNVDWLGLGAPRWGAEDAFNEALINLRGYGGRPADERSAVDLLEEAARLDPGFPDAHERLGTIRLQQAQQRLGFVRQLLDQSDHARAQSQAQAVLELLDQAAAAHQRALEAYPRSFNSLTNLGASHLLRGETVATMAAAANAAGDTAAASRLGASAFAAYQEATSWFDRALRLNPEDRMTRENRAYAEQRRDALAAAPNAPPGP